MRLAKAKAKVATEDAPQEAIIIAADTTVVGTVKDNAGKNSSVILGKPGNPEEARDMLVQLRGKTHQVYTALAVYSTADLLLYSDLCVTDVPMRAYTDNEIEAYIASGDPFDKAGGYAIQHSGFHPVESLSGCYANVVGLPLCHLTRTLQRFGIKPHNDIPTSCQQTLNFECTVFDEILELQ